MNRNLFLRLNRFPQVPHSLRADPSIDAAANVVEVNLLRVSHHEFVDSLGYVAGAVELTNSPVVTGTTGDPLLRFRRDRLGSHAEAQRGIVNRYGKAFCRNFLYEHCAVTYFAHVDRILGRPIHRAFNQLSVHRLDSGDLPDYFCARSADRFYVAEAKGRTRSIAFKTKEFGEWRRQFDRLQVRHWPSGAVRVKGYIVATRFVSEDDSPKVQPALYAEDPETPGEVAADELGFEAGAGILAHHYSDIMRGLGLPLVGSALENGHAIDGPIRRLIGIWKCRLPELAGLKFVGGIVRHEPLPSRAIGGLADRFDLSGSTISMAVELTRPCVYFFGIDERVFFQLIETVRTQRLGMVEGQYELPSEIPPTISLMRDGTVFGLQYFFALDRIQIL